jgi:hypothetical protein
LKEEGSSATSNVRDVADVTDVKDGSPIEVGRGKREEGRKNIVEKKALVIVWSL